MNDFWKRCNDAGCVIVVVKTYSGYKNGNIDDSLFIGFKYAALAFDNVAVGDDYWFMIDEGHSGYDKLFLTPEEALTDFENMDG